MELMDEDEKEAQRIYEKYGLGYIMKAPIPIWEAGMFVWQCTKFGPDPLQEMLEEKKKESRKVISLNSWKKQRQQNKS